MTQHRPIWRNTGRCVSTLGIMAVSIAALAGCTSQALTETTATTTAVESPASTEAAPSVKPVQVTDIPLPRDSRIEQSESLVIGSGNRWLGRLVVKVRTDAAETYSYYFNGMPRLGWARMTAVQGKVSSLTFTNGDRVANLQITGGVGGATVTIFVSTREIEGG